MISADMCEPFRAEWVRCVVGTMLIQHSYAVDAPRELLDQMPNAGFALHRQEHVAVRKVWKQRSNEQARHQVSLADSLPAEGSAWV
jgi:hypothetical protein